MNDRQWMASDDDMKREDNRKNKGVWDMSNFRRRLVQAGTVMMLSLMALGGTRLALAEGLLPEPEAAVVQNETQSPASFAFPTFYLSAPGTGNVAGNGYADEDIMRYNSGANTWSKAFDGTNAGLPDSADIDALTLIVNSGYISFLMSFENPTAVPGLGTIDDSDVARYDTFNGQWSLYLDGSAHGLSTNAEDIDALTFSAGGFLAVSTTGSYAVKNLGGGTTKGTDEDLVLLVNPATSEWTKWLDGNSIGLQATNDIRGVSFLRVDDAIVDDARYIVAQSAFTLPNGVAIGANDVAEQVWFQNGSMEYYKKADNSGIGFPKIDAIEVVK